MAIEYRSASNAAVDADTGKISGLAAPFNNQTVIGDLRYGGFRETFAPGAFSKSLQERDIVLLVNHDSSKPIARTSAGSLNVRQTERGLEFDATPNNTSYAQDLMENLRTGVVNGTSFGFSPVKEDWTDDDGNPASPSTGTNRTVREAKLYEITAATFPAYDGTELAVRDAVVAAREDRAKYNAAQLKQMLAKGEAFKNANGEPSYPIADVEDLANAIHAVGRGGADHNAIRAYIIRRAKAMKASKMIPDNWNADGSLKGQNSESFGDNLSDITSSLIDLYNKLPAEMRSEVHSALEIRATNQKPEEVAEIHQKLAGVDASLDEACKLFQGAERDSLPANVNQAIDLVSSASAEISQVLAEKGIPDPDKPNGSKYADQKPDTSTSGRSAAEMLLELENRRYV